MSRTPRELKTLCEQGTNITQLLREEQGLDRNTDAIIEVAYDLQAGSYIAAMDDPAMAEHKRVYADTIAATIRELCEPVSVMEAGVGEATTLSGVMRALGPGVDAYGFDLSWSRVACAHEWLRRQGDLKATLCTGNLFDIPFVENAVDVVYTSHSIEPNGGNERPILEELLRVTGRYLVLLEPGYELASDEARARMESHGYCRGLVAHLEQMGHEVLKHELFPHAANPLNPTALTIVRKSESFSAPDAVLACPRYKTPLAFEDGSYFGSEALAAYPVIRGVPCLTVDASVFASRVLDISD